MKSYETWDILNDSTGAGFLNHQQYLGNNLNVSAINNHYLLGEFPTGGKGRYKLPRQYVSCQEGTSVNHRINSQPKTLTPGVSPVSSAWMPARQAAAMPALGHGR